MAETSAIEWTDATVNFWWGCTKVGPGCDHCYAETLNAFRGSGEWGTGAPRRKIKGATALLATLNRKPWKDELGRRRRVFMSSMCDVFDNEVDDEWRMEALYGAQHATNLDIQLLTKRISNVAKMVPPSWLLGWPRHVGLMITVVNQQEAERDIPRLLSLKHDFYLPWVGLSCEPLLGQLRLDDWLADLDWVIVGGESGRDARPMHPGWVRGIRDQCAVAGVPFLFKQWGNWRTPFLGEYYDTAHGRAGKPVAFIVSEDGSVHCFWNEHIRNSVVMIDVGKKAAGRLLDGVEHNGFPRIAG